MNKEQKIQFIREKCIEANPSIKDLVFGCDVIVKGIANDNPGCEYDIVVDDRIKEGRIGLGYFGEVPISELEIIGREIRLADVLLAMPTNSIFVCAKDGYIGHDEEMIKGHFKVQWNLLNDSLTDQEEPTIDFIYELLHE